MVKGAFMELGLKKNHASLCDPDSKMERKDNNDYYRLYKKKGPPTRLVCLQNLQDTYIIVLS